MPFGRGPTTPLGTTKITMVIFTTYIHWDDPPSNLGDRGFSSPKDPGSSWEPWLKEMGLIYPPVIPFL